MKQLSIVYGLMAMVAMLTSCNEDPEYFTLPVRADEMHIRCSVDEIVLNKGKGGETAVTFSWDKATSPLSASDEVTYSLCIYPSAMKEQKSAYMDAGTRTSYEMTHDQLNSMVARWALPGQTVRLTAQVVCQVHNETRYVRPEVSTVEFTAIGYEKYPACLYMVMTDAATGVVTTQRMDQRQLGTGIYEASVNLKPCSYHFATSEEAYPLYAMATSGNQEQMEYVNEGAYTDFDNSVNGRRTIIVDTNPEYNDCRVLDIVALPSPGVIWICGNGCSVGWNANSPAGHMDMVGTAREPYYYAWTGDFVEGGELKIGLGGSWGDNFFFAPETNADPLTDHRLSMYRLQDAGGDVKWVPTVSGRYTFTLCLLASDLHTTFEPAE